MNLLDALQPAAFKPQGARRISLLGDAINEHIQEEPVMPRGVYERKKRTELGVTPKIATPSVSKKSRGQYSQVLADLREKRNQIDAAIAAIEAL